MEGGGLHVPSTCGRSTSTKSLPKDDRSRAYAILVVDSRSWYGGVDDITGFAAPGGSVGVCAGGEGGEDDEVAVVPRDLIKGMVREGWLCCAGFLVCVVRVARSSLRRSRRTKRVMVPKYISVSTAHVSRAQPVGTHRFMCMSTNVSVVCPCLCVCPCPAPVRVRAHRSQATHPGRGAGASN